MKRENKKAIINNGKSYFRASYSNNCNFKRHINKVRSVTTKTGLPFSCSNFNEKEKQDIRNFVIDLLGNDPINCYKDIVYDNRFGSLRNISDRLGISRSTLRIYILNWLEYLYEKNTADRIFKIFWPENSAKQKEKVGFYEIIEKYIRLYPERTSLIPTRNKLLNSELRNLISKNTFKLWVIDYLTQIKGLSLIESHEIYNNIWGKQCAKRKKIEYDDIKSFLYQLYHGKARILTPKVAFESMYDYPTERYLNISCGNGHKFPIRVRKLIYEYNWCPYCNEYLCEKVMRNYLEQFFNTKFEAQVRLENACGIHREKIIRKAIEINGINYIIPVFVGQLRYDQFCHNVCIIGRNGTKYKFSVAGEYDGSHHDEEDLIKNPFCNNLEDFASIKARDSVKNKVSYKKKVILIRLKEKNGFDRKKLIYNQKEVIQEFIRQFNNQVKELFGYRDVLLKYDPYIKYKPFG